MALHDMMISRPVFHHGGLFEPTEESSGSDYSLSSSIEAYNPTTTTDTTYGWILPAQDYAFPSSPSNGLTQQHSPPFAMLQTPRLRLAERQVLEMPLRVHKPARDKRYSGARYSPIGNRSRADNPSRCTVSEVQAANACIPEPRMRSLGSARAAAPRYQQQVNTTPITSPIPGNQGLLPPMQVPLCIDTGRGSFDSVRSPVSLEETLSALELVEQFFEERQSGCEVENIGGLGLSTVEGEQAISQLRGRIAAALQMEQLKRGAPLPQRHSPTLSAGPLTPPSASF